MSARHHVSISRIVVKMFPLFSTVLRSQHVSLSQVRDELTRTATAPTRQHSTATANNSQKLGKHLPSGCPCTRSNIYRCRLTALWEHTPYRLEKSLRLGLGHEFSQRRERPDNLRRVNSGCSCLVAEGRRRNRGSCRQVLAAVQPGSRQQRIS